MKENLKPTLVLSISLAAVLGISILLSKPPSKTPDPNTESLTNNNDNAAPHRQEESLANLTTTNTMRRIASTLQGLRDSRTYDQQEWIDRFPYEKTYSEELKFDPSLYDPKDPATWNTDLVQAKAMKKHGFLARFYDHPMRFSREFEAAYNILAEHEVSDQVLPVASLFQNLLDYTHAVSQPPGSQMFKVVKVYDEKLKKVIDRHELLFRPDGSPKLYEQDAELLWNSMVSRLALDRFWPSGARVTDAQAEQIVSELVTEISSEGLLALREKYAFGFAYSQVELEQLQPGDPLLVN